MPNKMLVDATHPEETRVVVLRGNRVEEFDYESANRKQLRGNIYLAKVTRVEPSLQAAFVEYGGNRHGFLAFSEIHPDYYQIPTADRQALLEDEARAHRDEEDEHERKSNRRRGRHRDRGARRRGDATRRSEPIADNAAAPAGGDEAAFVAEATQDVSVTSDFSSEVPVETNESAAPAFESNTDTAAPAELPFEAAAPVAEQPEPAADQPETTEVLAGDTIPEAGSNETATEADAYTGHYDTVQDVSGHDESAQDDSGEDDHDEEDEEEHVEVVGGADAMEEAAPPRPRHRRQYKIQEVIKRRQVMLVQVVKEERGTKGAALTTYLSLAGRYSVLMPNTARGGGISRKITSAEDRRRMKEMVEDLQVPEGMGIILRTTGQNRTKTEIKRDFEYLLRVWEQVRDLTLNSTAPTLVYEEGSLTKRSIRDLYNKDIDEVVVAGERGYRDAKDFMRMLMPSHAKNVKLYRDSQPIFTRYGIESQLDAMFSPTVQLKSGGYIVINQTEALVAIDVNSGRATREHHIEDTALKTNLEAADEVARQLRLRDLAGLIVIDFIDMDEGRNNRTVERRMKEALKHDRARIQVGRISHFGLLEMSRQRIRTSVLESSTEKCPYCGGSGHVRSVSSVCLQMLRALEEQLLKGATHNLVVRTRSEVALYALNHKRAHLRALEDRFEIAIVVNADPDFVGQMSFEITRGEQVHSIEDAKAIAARTEPLPPMIDEEDVALDAEYADAEAEAIAEDEAGSDDAGDDNGEQDGDEARGDEQQDGGRRRRRRRGRRGRGRHRADCAPPPANDAEGPADVAMAGDEAGDLAGDNEADGEAAAQGENDQQNGDRDGQRRRRRGRRGGRRNRERRDGFVPAEGQHDPSMPEQPDFLSAPLPPPTDQPAHEPAPQVIHHEPIVAAEAPAPSAPAAVAAEAPAAAKETAKPRRRSTIREPAPVANSAAAAAQPVAPAPVAPTATEPAPAAESPSDDGAPAKRGWWGRRLLGN
ncbi:MAG: Rne/Rng family ribonuclease [Pseudolabrys sp.]